MSEWSILLLGIPRVEYNKQIVQIERRKAFGLLAYLVVTGQPSSREALARLFWADYDHARAHAYLRNHLWTLNKALGDDWAAIDNEMVKFNDTAIDVDVNRLLTALRSPSSPSNHAEYINEVNRLTEIVNLYRSDFLSGLSLHDSAEFEEWKTVETEHFRREFATILECLIGYLIALGDFETSKTHTRRWLSLDTLNETAHRQLMRLYVWTGQQSTALRQYKEVENILERELGIPPDSKTQHLYELIQSRTLPMPKQLEALKSRETMIFQAQTEINLPSANLPFIGRESELQHIHTLLDDPNCRLLSIIGSGGIGKTRLAIQVARKSTFRDGQCVVLLAPVGSPEFIIPTIATALKSTAPTPEDTKAHLLNELRNKELLLVLDNFEHLLSSAEILSEILAVAPNVKILAHVQRE